MGKYGYYTFFFHVFSVRYSDYKAFRAGLTHLLRLQEQPYLAFQINMLGFLKQRDKMVLLSSLAEFQIKFAPLIIMNNFILNKWELEMALFNPWTIIHNESETTPISNHKGSFLTKSA